MAVLRIRRQGVVVDPGGIQRQVARIQKRLKAGSRPVWPVVVHFAGRIKQSVDFDFRVGGRPPFVWRPNKPNTVAAKRHARQLVGEHGNRMQRGIKYLPGGSNPNYDIRVDVPFPGELHQGGRKGPWIIRPRRARVLAFYVAESRGSFMARRAKRKAAGKKFAAIPGRVRVTARKVIHPGYPARKFVVVRQELVQFGWRQPLRRFLFEGIVPKPVAGITG